MKTQAIKNNLLLNRLLNFCPYAEPSKSCILKPYRTNANKNSVQLNKTEVEKIMIFHNNCIRKRYLENTFKFHTQEISTLTIHENNIAKLIAEGNSNKEIADELFISLNTVKFHRKNIYRKLFVTKVTELIKMLFLK